MLNFYGGKFLGPRPCRKLKDRPLSVALSWYLNALTVSPHILHPKPVTTPCSGHRDPLTTALPQTVVQFAQSWHTVNQLSNTKSSEASFYRVSTTTRVWEHVKTRLHVLYLLPSLSFLLFIFLSFIIFFIFIFYLFLLQLLFYSFILYLELHGFRSKYGILVFFLKFLFCSTRRPTNHLSGQ